MQLAVAETKVAPAGQLTQADPPKLKVLFVQLVHEVAPLAAEAAPAAQLTQATEALLAAKVPGRQFVQLWAPARAYEPAAQGAQPCAATEPLLAMVPAKPGAQRVHAATEVLPADEAVVYTPIGQAVQPPALAVPAFTTVP